ncbi:MAG: universal stress protein [Planctomycetes bacterium]|nr:universal stress protein [Planctomycetota bacterium]
MLNRILVPLDGSELAGRILGPVRSLLLRQDAEVMFLRVLPGHWMAEEDRLWPGEGESPRTHLERLRNDLVNQGGRAYYLFRKGDPADEILKFAEDYQPSLIAMSTHGRTGVERWIRGSVAERVLRGSIFPLLLASLHGLEEGGDRRTGPFRRILVPLDGSERSARILPLVREIARLYHSEVVLVCVQVNLPSPEGAMIVPPADAALQVEPYRKKLEEADVPVRVLFPCGAVSHEILAAVEHSKIGLLAMTTHGRTGLSRWVFGSVAENVLRHCPCPLLVQRTVDLAGEAAERMAAEGPEDWT